MRCELSTVIVLVSIIVGMSLIAGISYYLYLNRKSENSLLKSKNRYYVNQYAYMKNQAFDAYLKLSNCVDYINELQNEELVVLPSELEEIKNTIYAGSQIMYKISQK